MNIGQVIDLYCYGTSEGAKKAWETMHQGQSKLAKGLRDRIKKDGGFTYSIAHNNSPTHGYALSIDPKNERILGIKEATAPRIKQILGEYKQALKSDPRAHVGGWYDPQSKKVFLDVSIVTNNKSEAMRLAKQHNQLAFFDLGKGQTITTGVKRNVKAQAAKQKLIKFHFPRNATAEQIAEYISKLDKENQ